MSLSQQTADLVLWQDQIAIKKHKTVPFACYKFDNIKSTSFILKLSIYVSINLNSGERSAFMVLTNLSFPASQFSNQFLYWFRYTSIFKD